MRIVIQRVSQAQVTIDQEVVGQIGPGLMLLVGVSDQDDQDTVAYMARKIANMRIFSDEAGKMNLSVKDIGGAVLSISQFTLYARTKKGNRPSFTDAGQPDYSNKIYQALNQALSQDYHLPVATGEFGADMQVSLVNDGPVTIILDSEE
ncbi:D-tyrosyl-tRNA(Tyr) deacylase [Aerococcus urinaehominis]|uniref:D-aminoacyl-tRNA deacylase n=1 Tax=Aerococcus urinaehominis TaxID=128944 RepID=A0A0X8FKX2_9LACT|nr:D-aminoacyl-tRNA deacylase [Aerococcus urinaehominis]AMB98512.1 D-tyrosyl-tRNA(Tyr) deacylase [Aerococcus urinaehominis]SDL80082.1 D-tyrosyl-tRNA(Tyr) deacylase [Aerococcus urinaehominis]